MDLVQRELKTLGGEREKDVKEIIRRITRDRMGQ